MIFLKPVSYTVLKLLTKVNLLSFVFGDPSNCLSSEDAAVGIVISHVPARRLISVLCQSQNLGSWMSPS